MSLPAEKQELSITSSQEDGLAALLEKLYSVWGRDFRDYKRASLRRRIAKRLDALNISSYKKYSEFLESDPAEFDMFCSTVTIKVSEFFRDTEVFERLKETIGIFFHDRALKAWCCGCSCGEEAYSLAMVLSMALSQEALAKTTVFATDIDIEALEQARRARYRADALCNANPELRARFFSAADGLYKVDYKIRNMVKFGQLDIVRSPSISKVQILLCRNLFIYFKKELQEKVFAKLDFALEPGGLLVLGRAETLPAPYSSRYEALAGRIKVYRKIRNIWRCRD